jgi:four helix bundle protein
MDKNILQQRTKQFNVDIILFCSNFPKSAAGFELAKQLIRSAGSVGANYRAALRAKSKADFVYKIKIVLEEADESFYWLEVVNESGLMKNDQLEKLLDEANQLTAIFSAIDKTTKRNMVNEHKNPTSTNPKS